MNKGMVYKVAVISKRIMFILLSILLVVLTTGAIWLWACSRGSPLPFVDGDGKPVSNSISEKLTLNINGAEQSMFIKGIDSTKPVLLYVHGGMPDYFLAQLYPPRFETDFVVVWWEQRGSGMSYKPGMDVQSISSSVLVADIIVLAKLLIKRFNKDKIYLAAHSGGTFVGMQAIAKAPTLFHAYIGIAQVNNQLRSEQLAKAYMLEQYKARGQERKMRKLADAPLNGNGMSNKYMKLRDGAMHELGIGTMRNMRSIVTGLFLPSLQCRDYSVSDKVNLWRAKAASGVSVVWREMLATDLSSSVHTVDVPVYFLHGAYDYTCSYSEAKRYFDIIHAPVKGFYTFPNAAHSPLFEDAGKMQEIIRNDVLQAKTSLSDP